MYYAQTLYFLSTFSSPSYLRYLDRATCELEAVHGGQSIIGPLGVQVLHEAEALVSPRGRVVGHVH